ncbi:DUF6318 family protein [Glutamicibacter sp. JL.03c]|uniref:DUF6318 family protein n=1 Tax=Glutamicibacter sp. JL.03c TaxID=2984842 RepID=UPI0021F7692A|nr:DUF6318 family protein [Glutamicibacter sp. JL.03c]UYQ76277.1 DUF6318 family protein [Glutamicibacter sp. JL.03c]
MDPRKLIVITVGIGLMLAGCSGSTSSDFPKPSETPSQSDSADSGEDVSKAPAGVSRTYLEGSSKGPAKNVPKPELPADAKEFTEASASSFVEYYFELLNYAIETNEVAEVKRLSSKECELCDKSIINEAEAAQKSGEWQVGGEHHPKILDSHISGKNVAIVTVEYTADSAKVYSAPGKLQEELDKIDPNRLAFDLEYDEGWRVYKILGAN